jgi:hypothetical protein
MWNRGSMAAAASRYGASGAPNNGLRAADCDTRRATGCHGIRLCVQWVRATRLATLCSGCSLVGLSLRGRETR